MEVEPLVWNDSFATGVQEIDEQHMILVDLLNNARVKLVPGSDAKIIEQIILDLLSYALYHFETEERLMDAYDYREGSSPDATQHLEQHRAFSDRVVWARRALTSGEKISSDELLQFLTDWLVNHILKTDFKLGAYILEKRVRG